LIREGLAGKRILMTGATGFLGTALFERLLTDIPVERVDLLIRRDAPARLRTMLGGAAFKPAADRVGGVEALRELAAGKVRPLPADLTQGTIPVDDDIDLVIHTAATVSFDPPVDDAFETNLLGTLALYEASGGRPFIHVSTAYVAGLTRGTQPEELLTRPLRWRTERDAALRVRAEVASLLELSGHADQRELLEWMKPITPHLKKVFLVHGELPAQQALAKLIAARYDVAVECPARGASFSL